MTPTAEEIRDQLAPLRELEPSSEQLHRALDAAPRRRRRGRRPALAVAGAAAAVTAVIAALPGGQPTGAAALRAAAAAAADQAGPAAFEGYRYVLMRDRRQSMWGVPEEGCEPKPARPGINEPGCPMAQEATYVEEGRLEIWVDSRQSGTRRDHGSRVVEAQGDPELAAALREELGRKPSTDVYEYGDGAFAKVPLAQLPTEPRALLAELRAAYDDGRWAGNPSAYANSTRPASTRDYELALFTVLLLAEANATPELRAAGFGALAEMPGLRALGETTDGEGREGQGIELAFAADPNGFRGPTTLRVVFDEERGDLLSWSDHQVLRGRRMGVEWTLLETDHVRSAPAVTRP
jgi:hypothetical protein